jgi:hypothetical protein
MEKLAFLKDVKRPSTSLSLAMEVYSWETTELFQTGICPA